MSKPIPSSWKAAAFLVLVLTLWMLSGLFASDNPVSGETTTQAENLPMAVEVTIARSMRMPRDLELYGQLDPIRHVLVKAQTNGEVQEIIARKGMRIEAGAALVRLDNGGRNNALAEAQALVKSARSEQQAAQSLRRQGLQSKVQLEQADAVLEAARARLATVELDIENTTITAPFSGVIDGLPVETGTLVDHGDVIAELVDDSAFKASAQISQQALADLSLGQVVNVNLITGQTLRGKVSFIGSVADKQTRSFAMEALVDNTDNTIAAGVSATLSIPVDEVDATFITPSALSLGNDGTLGVKALDEQDHVIFLPIELVSTALDGAWVSGIPAGTRVITLGQGFVNTGEKVRVQVAGAS